MRSKTTLEQLDELFELRMRELREREAARDREAARQREENATLRRELEAVRLETAELKAQLRGHIERADRAARLWWGLAYGLAIASNVFAWLLFLWACL